MIIQYAALALVQRHMKLHHTPPTLQIFMRIYISVQFFKTRKNFMSKHISLFELCNVIKFQRQEWLIIIYTYFCNISSNYLFNNRILSFTVESFEKLNLFWFSNIISHLIIVLLFRITDYARRVKCMVSFSWSKRVI